MLALGALNAKSLFFKGFHKNFNETIKIKKNSLKSYTYLISPPFLPDPGNARSTDIVHCHALDALLHPGHNHTVRIDDASASVTELVATLSHDVGRRDPATGFPGAILKVRDAARTPPIGGCWRQHIIQRVADQLRAAVAKAHGRRREIGIEADIDAVRDRPFAEDRTRLSRQKIPFIGVILGVGTGVALKGSDA